MHKTIRKLNFVYPKNRFAIVSLIILITSLMSVNGNTLVTASEGEAPEFFLYLAEIEKNTSLRIEPGYKTIRYPSIYKDKIVFMYDNKHNKPAHPFEGTIVVYNISSTELVEIGFGSWPKIWGDYVVYQLYDNNASRQIIKLYDIISKETLTISGKSNFRLHDIFQNTIIWTGNLGLYLYNIDNETYYTINKIKSLKMLISSAEIFANYIIFSARTNTTKSDIYLYNISIDGLIRLNSTFKFNIAPYMYNNKVTWLGYNDSTILQSVLLLNITSREQNILTTKAFSVPFLYESDVVWLNPSHYKNGWLTLNIYNISTRSIESMSLMDYYDVNYWYTDFFGSTFVWVGTPYDMYQENPENSFLSTGLTDLIVTITIVALISNRATKRNRRINGTN